MSSPLGRIALALSGGGFRAAAFHLGTMRALRAVGLFDDVRLLSTASGGSIVGAAWVCSLVEGKSFEAFDEQLRQLLRTNVVADALDLLHKGRRRKSLIQRAAEVYDGHFKGRRLGELSDDEKLKSRLDHVVINATHFSLGYGFRFTFPPRPRAPFGNREVSLEPKSAWRDVRLSDAVAASSCFPAGFEPLLFPHDFAWTNGAAPTVSAEVPYATEPEHCLPLMDGGIYDNQAIDSLLLIDRAKGGNADPDDDLGLMFCSDTDQKQMPFFSHARPGPLRKALNWVPLWAAALALGGASAAAAWLSQRGGALGTAALVAASLLGAPVAVLPLLLLKAQTSVPFSYPKLSLLLLRTSLGDLLGLVAARITSVLALTTKVFMYRVRALAYDVARLKMPNRVVESHVYDGDLEGSDDWAQHVVQQAARARNVDTKLWMSQSEQDDVIATGHAAAIGALRRYLQRWKRTGAEFRPDREYPAELAARVEEEWKRLNAPGAERTAAFPVIAA